MNPTLFQYGTVVLLAPAHHPYQVASGGLFQIVTYFRLYHSIMVHVASHSSTMCWCKVAYSTQPNHNKDGLVERDTGHAVSPIPILPTVGMQNLSVAYSLI